MALEPLEAHQVVLEAYQVVPDVRANLKALNSYDMLTLVNEEEKSSLKSLRELGYLDLWTQQLMVNLGLLLRAPRLLQEGREEFLQLQLKRRTPSLRGYTFQPQLLKCPWISYYVRAGDLNSLVGNVY